jgi:hypothetical protein
MCLAMSQICGSVGLFGDREEREGREEGEGRERRDGGAHLVTP